MHRNILYVEPLYGAVGGHWNEMRASRVSYEDLLRNQQ